MDELRSADPKDFGRFSNVSSRSFKPVLPSYSFVSSSAEGCAQTSELAGVQGYGWLEVFTRTVHPEVFAASASIPSGPVPTWRNTSGCTMPQPSTRVQPVCLHTRQHVKGLQMTQEMSTSAEGLVNGKYDGRKRSLSFCSKNCSRKSPKNPLQVRKRHGFVHHEPSI